MTILALMQRILKAMKLHYTQLLRFIFPPSEDERIINGVAIDDLLQIYTNTPTHNALALLPYSDPRVRSAIHLVKFHNHTHARNTLACVLAKYLAQRAEPIVTLIPIPLSSKRRRARGHNQVSTIIKSAIGTNARFFLEERVLLRPVHTLPQTSLSRSARLVNISGVFSIGGSRQVQEAIAGTHIVLVDDVTTTGTTLKEAKHILQKLKPASITCIALAH